MDALKVFDGLPIPIDYASTQTYALLARRDGGKTYTTLKFEEQMCDAGLFFVTLDPVGKHYALRAGRDGSARGGKKDVWVLGGAHGDVPLEPTSGELIADTVVDHPGRYILDVSTFESDAEQDRFAAAFGQRLFRRKAKDPGWPMLLILEEAESFIPQNPQQGQQRMLGTYGRIMRHGRNYGLGMWMVAQRAQALNKGVLSQAEVLVVKQMAHNRDIAAVDEWIKAQQPNAAERAELLGSLAGLEQNEAFVWSPSWLRDFRRCTVLPRVTFDSSASVKGGERARAVELSPLDVAALGEKIAETAERAKADDPKALHAEIRRLNKQLAERAGVASDEDLAAEYRAGVEWAMGHGRAELDVIERRAREIEAKIADMRDYVEEVVKGFEPEGYASTNALMARKGVQTVAAPTGPAAGDGARARRSNGGRRAPLSPSAGSGNAVDAGGSREQPASRASGDARQKVLDALRWWECVGASPVTRLQVAMVVGSHPRTGTFAQALADLARDEMIVFPDRGMVELLDAGRARAQEPAEIGGEEDLHAMVYRQVGERRAEILNEVVAAYPDGVERTELAERLGVHPRTGTFAQAIADLKALGVAWFPRRGVVAASPMLFFEARQPVAR